MSAHTPTPWFHYVAGGHPTAIAMQPDSPGIIRIAEMNGQHTEEGREQLADDAAFIVRACNAHDDLIAALRLVRRGLETGAISARGPVMDFSNLDVESIPMRPMRPMRPLSLVIDEVLAKAEAA